MIYEFSSIEYVFDVSLAIVSLIVSLLCSAGVTFISCKPIITNACSANQT